MRIVKILSGNLLMALAYSFITVPNDIVNGGVTSLAMICAELLGLDVALCSNLFTVLLMIICAVFLGKSYFMGTVYSCIAYMALFIIFSHTGFELHIFSSCCSDPCRCNGRGGVLSVHERKIDRYRF